MSSPKTQARWFSANPARAAFERFVLLYTPVWIAFVGVVMLTGLYSSWGDGGFMLFGLAAGAPLVLVPWLRPTPEEARRPFWQTSWFRQNLWIAIFVFIGSYFLTHYFFDVLGMRYRFPTRWNVQAVLVGAGEIEGGGREVPLFLYPLTQAYFMTYHVVMTVILRYLSTRFSLGVAAKILVVAVLAYAVAFAETFFMAVPAIGDIFEYLDRDRMLAYGSLFYASYFVVSLPIFARVDEDRPWGLTEIVASSLAAGMAVFILLDLWAAVIGPL